MNFKVNVQKYADIRGHESPTNLQNFMQKDLTEVKIFQKVLGGYFFKTPCRQCWPSMVQYGLVLVSSTSFQHQKLASCALGITQYSTGRGQPLYLVGTCSSFQTLKSFCYLLTARSKFSLTRLVMQIFQSVSTVHHSADVTLHDVNHLINLVLQSASNTVSKLTDQLSKFVIIYSYLIPIL